VQLNLEPTESVFVVFREKAPKNKAVVADKVMPVFKPIQEVTGPWDLRFPANWGAPEMVTLEKLISWTEHADVGVKYFSGTAVYSKVITIPSDLIGKDKPLYLDLGRVEVMAEVKLNGQNLGILWTRPFRVDVSAAAKAGENALEVKVVNLWPNRLIRDAGLPEKERLTWLPNNPYSATHQPIPSGLFGPVRLMTVASEKVSLAPSEAKVGKITFTASSSLEAGGWSVANLVAPESDKTKKGYSSVAHNGATGKEWVEIDLGEEVTLKGIVLVPRSDAKTKDEGVACFPRDFTVQIGTDPEKFTTVAALTHCPAPDAKGLSVDLSTVIGYPKVRFIEINVTRFGEPAADEAGVYRLQLERVKVIRP
jgi:hypothetical protein